MKSCCLNEGCYLKNGEYRITRTLGQGGFGITYEAEQISLGRKVAIKEFFMKEYCVREADTSQVLTPSVGSREQVDRFRLKFIKEARLIASLDHPNIIRVQDVFEENGTAYYVMNYMPNGSLKDKVEEDGPLSTDEIDTYIHQLCSALEYLHSKNVLHLDVKPSNILFDKNGNAVLIDFGISKHYDDNGEQTTSTPAGISKGYAPLEQYQIGSLDTFTPATDIYSLAATLYYMTTGTVPPEAITIYNQGLPSLKSTLPNNIKETIEQSMQSRREDRPQNVGEFLSLIEATDTFCPKYDILQLKQMKVEDLRSIAKDFDIKSLKSKTKNDLVYAILDAQISNLNTVTSSDTTVVNTDNSNITNIEIKNTNKDERLRDSVISNLSYSFFKLSKSYRWRRYPYLYAIVFITLLLYAYSNNRYCDLLPFKIIGEISKTAIGILVFVYIVTVAVTISTLIYCLLFSKKEKSYLDNIWKSEVIANNTPIRRIINKYALFPHLFYNDSCSNFIIYVFVFVPICLFVLWMSVPEFAIDNWKDFFTLTTLNNSLFGIITTVIISFVGKTEKLPFKEGVYSWKRIRNDKIMPYYKLCIHPKDLKGYIESCD